MATYQLNTDAFIIEGYNRTKPFASFLPGIAGLWGIPMWAFYVNRGQALAGFGIQDKDHPIMEFVPANRAYRSVPVQGFRTFLKIRSRHQAVLYEPFRTPLSDSPREPVQRMHIRMHEVELEERSTRLGLDIRVQYFTMPHAPYAALVRVLRITNRSRSRRAIDVIDGLPLIVPYGTTDTLLKQMSRTLEAWISVQDIRPRVPFYRLKVEPHDRPDVARVHAGNFYVSFTDGPRAPRLAAPIVDPFVVFGRQDNLVYPERFAQPSFRLPAHQVTADKTPSAMGYLDFALRPDETRTIYSLFGHANSADQLRTELPGMLTRDVVLRGAQANQTLIEHLTQPIATQSRFRAFDLYCRQTFLDNALRGGMPVALGREETGRPPSERKIFYVFCRKHGDLERDYNRFVIPPTPFSQGNANYRDVNQNRRTNAWFHPEVGEADVITFFNLIQLDGFNPLIFKGLRCLAPDSLQRLPHLHDVLSRPFSPGELVQAAAAQQAALGEPLADFLHRLISRVETIEDAEHGDGFWTDHWTYNMDLFDSYLALYPDRLRSLLFDQRVLTCYDNAYVVAPRARKYRRTRAGIRQVHAVHRDLEKEHLIHSRTSRPHCVRTAHGLGEVYTTTLVVKMLCVMANKMASLDPSGIGIEMEAEKPNWYDALNGLPGLFGSSLCETFELHRWMRFVQEAIARLAVPPPTTLMVPEELHRLLMAIQNALALADADYWAQATTAKEQYREQTRLGVSGQEQPLSIADLLEWLRRSRVKLERGIAMAFDRSRGLYRSYFSHEVTAYDTSGDSRHPTILPTRWRRHDLPVFLAGMVHALRATSDPRRAKALHRAVKRSPLYDRALRMYRLCESLADESEDIGRCRIFNPGWLENQSVWLHMEYKYLLELLRTGLYTEFYEEFFNVLIPFQPAQRYGRSILENSSFLVSSVYPDPTLHGTGFVARLSGATAEFLHMWLWMTAGRRPFTVGADGQLELRLAPILSPKLFDAKGRFRFRLLGTIDVTYHNPLRRATFGPRAVTPQTIRVSLRNGQQVDCRDGLIPMPYADMVRRQLAERIRVDLAPAPRRSSHLASADQPVPTPGGHQRLIA